MAGVVLFLTNAVLVLLRLKTSPLLICLLALHRSQASYNVTILLFYDEPCDECFRKDPSQLSHQDIFPRKSEVIDFRWFQVNATSINRSQVGVFNTLEFLEKLSATVAGVIFIDVTPDSVAFASLLKSLQILTVGLFQEQGVFRTEEHPGDFTRVVFPSIIRYVTSAWRFIKKHGWGTISLVLSSDYEGFTFMECMQSYAVKEKWQILKVVWLTEGVIGNDTKTELKDVVADRRNDVVVVHSRFGQDGQFFELVQELGVSKPKAVWIITEITSHQFKNCQELPQGLLRINLKRPEKQFDYNIYENALHDAILLFQLSFEESFRECSLNFNEEDCGQGNTLDNLRRIFKRHLTQKSFSRRSVLFDPLALKNKHPSFTIWNLKGHGDGAKKWFPAGMGATTGLAMERFTAPNGKLIKPVSEIPKRVIRVAVNEYPPLVNKVLPGAGKECFGRFVACYENSRENMSANTQPKMFCCFGASLDFLSFLQKDLNFDAYIYFTPDGKFGVFNSSTGEWNGIVQELISGRAALSLELGLNSRRAEVLGYAHPTLLLELGILVKNGHKDINRDSWLRPFSTVLWLTLMATACIVFVVIWCLDRKSPQGYYQMLKGSDEDGFTLLDSISYVGGVAFGKDIGPVRTPLSTSSRFVSYVYSFLALIMINSYCANLMAFLVEEKIGLPITGVYDPKLISEPPKFKVAAVRGSNEEDHFKNHVNSSFRKIYDVNLRKNSVTSLTSGVEQMKAGTIDGLIGDFLSLRHIASTDKSCSFSLIKENSLKSGYGFAVSKHGMPWLQEISLSVLKHQENSTVQSIEERWFPKQTCGGKEHRRFAAIDFVGLFWVVAGVTAFSLLALLVESLMVFTLLKCGKRLGPFGRLLKRFLFNVKKGEEDHFTLQYRQAGLIAKNWTVETTNEEIAQEELGHENQGFVDIRELERKIASLQ